MGGMREVEQKVREILQLADWNQGQLADRIGVSQATVSRWLTGSDPKGEHHIAINALHEELIDNVPIQGLTTSIVRVVGYVGAGAVIEPDFEQEDPDGLDQIELPFPVPAEMIAFQVRGDSMFPVYKDGAAIIAYREQKRPLSSFFGEDAIVRTSDGRRLLKTIMRGSSVNVVNLSSFNAPPIEDVRLEWVGEIWTIFPRSQIKYISKSGGIQGRLRLASGG